MKTLYLDLTTGLSGDMLMAALLDLGLSIEKIEDALSSLELDGYDLQIKRVQKKGLGGLHFRVQLLKEEEEERDLSKITSIIRGGRLPEEAKETAIKVFKNLAEAEALAHGISIEEVHFHEVGALDSIIDIVGVSLGIHFLEIEKITASSVPLGEGYTDSRHGRIPIPAPATSYLLTGAPCYGTGIRAELVTPTGAAFLKTFVQEFGPMPRMLIQGVGIGVGSRDLEVPNILRVFLGEKEEEDTKAIEAETKKETEKERIMVCTTTMDDLSPEVLPYVRERLFQAGALDVFITPTLMKKGRSGFEVQILLPVEREEEISTILFEETSTLGIRIHEEERLCLRRSQEKVLLYGQEIRVKIGIYRGRIINIAPEYEDCRRVAKEERISLQEVYRQAVEVYGQRTKEDRYG